MKRERYIEILAEELIRIGLYSSDDSIEDVKQYLLSEGKTDWEAAALTAMQRAVEEETARLKQCEAIVRELASSALYKGMDDDTSYYRNKAREWVKDNPE